MKYYSISKVSLFGLWLALVSIPVWGQQSFRSDDPEPADITGIADKTETTPANNSVLTLAPNQLLLAFPEQVRLVKLTLHNELRDWVDIHFRYNPATIDNFSWSLPALQSATYYTADWAILSLNERLVKGTFSFAFGPGAEPPSVSKEAAALLLELGNGGTSLRPGQSSGNSVDIIINQDPPTFDPPFTILLDDDEPRRNRRRR